MAGIVVTKAELDYALGLSMRQLWAALENVERVASFTSTTQEAALITMGYSADEAYAIKLFYEDPSKLGAIRTLYDAMYPDLKKFMGIPLVEA